MQIISEYFDDEGIKRSTVTKEKDVYHVTLFYKNEELRVRTFFEEELADNYAEDWVSINE